MESTTLSKIEKLKKLPTNQLKSVKQLIAKQLLANGTNVALHEALKKPKTSTFRQGTKRAIESQILHVARMDSLALKKDEFYKALTDDWIKFEEAFPGGRKGILIFLLFAAEEGGQAGLDKMLPNQTFGLGNKALQESLEKRLDFFVKTIDKTTMDWIKRVVKEGQSDNLSNFQIIKGLREIAPEVATTRADLIAETELMVSMGKIELEVFKRNGIGKVRWVTSLDERTCPICMTNEDAGAIDVGKAFPEGQKYPPAHIRCRCFLLPVLPDTIEGEVWTGE